MQVRSPILAPLVAAFLFSLHSPALAGTSHTVKPPPAWVQPLPVTDESDGASGDGQNGIKHILADHQIRVTTGTVDRYYRRVKKVISASGLEDVAELQLDFEPSYQQHIIHHIRILRGAAAIDALRPREIKIIQKESDLDQRLYYGTLSALIFLHDVRVGDRIDYAYSINGDNPVLEATPGRVQRAASSLSGRDCRNGNKAVERLGFWTPPGGVPLRLRQDVL